MAGEQIHLALDVTDNNGMPSDISSVAYVELCDNRRMVTQGIAKLENGKGELSLDLSQNLHSGTYQLTVYTRYMRNFGEACFKKRNIGIINVMHISHEDRVIFTEKDSLCDLTNGGITNKRNYNLGEMIKIALPDSDSYRAISIEPINCISENDFAEYKQDYKNESSNTYLPELEGHIITAHAVNNIKKLDNARLALIGRSVRLFDAQLDGDTTDQTCQFYTNNINGRQPLMVNGFDTNGDLIKLSVESPFAKVKAKGLPPLTIYYNKDAMRQRCAEVIERHKDDDATSTLDSVEHSVNFMSFEPDKFYDLNEYAKFSSVKEILVEFIKGVKREKNKGHYQLYTRDDVTKKYTEWPALILLDGIPIDDVDQMLEYDARRLRYVQIYNGIYVFGNTIKQGVISFISHRGRLSNFELEDSYKLFSYSFPAGRQTKHDNNRWIVNPMKKSAIQAPSQSGIYKITAFGAKGRKVAVVEVK